VPANTLDALLATALDHLAGLMRRFEPGDSLRVQKLLAQLGRRRFPDAASLIRFHEILLFLRAYPHNPSIRSSSEELLASFHKRVARLRASGSDVSAFADPPVSGVAGTAFSAIWSHDIARYLAARYPSRVEIDWEGYEGEEQLVSVLKSFLPLFEDGAYVVYPVPYLAWIRAAKRPNETDLAWLLRQFEQLSIPDREKANLFDSLGLWIHWKLGNSPATRTKMRARANRIFYHDGPLINRSEVSLDQELEDHSPLPFKKLSRADGEKLVGLGRDMMTVRYRELHGFTYGDPRHVVRAAVGRGVEFVVWGCPPERRLPLLGYHAVMILKNGVPVGYAESLALFERSEVGINLFYTFRDGESAWIYARLLRLLRQYLQASVFSVEPYQLGSHNAEGIEAGAFWFYRKLGFRPVQPQVARMVMREERKLAKRPGYRTPARILRQLAAGHLLYEAPSAPHPGEWDNFRVPNIGLAVQRRLSFTAQQFGGGERKHRQALVTSVGRTLGVKPTDLSASEHRVFSDFALVLAMIPDLSRWSKEEKSAITQIVRAKTGPDELRYVRLLQSHQRLRDGLRTIGSSRLLKD
jgi:hypothetical protein